MTPREILARTAWAEARGDGEAGMQAVISTILNRVAEPGWWGHDIPSVCTAHLQFSCWNTNDPNRRKLLAVTMSDPQYSAAFVLAGEAIAGTLPDNVKGATSYKVSTLPWPHAWGPVVKPVATVGHQDFYILT